MVIKIINANRFATTYFISFKLLGFIIENNFDFRRIKTIINFVSNIMICNDWFFFNIIMLFQICDVVRHFNKTRNTHYKIIIFFWKVCTSKNISIAKISVKKWFILSSNLIKSTWCVFFCLSASKKTFLPITSSSPSFKRFMSFYLISLRFYLSAYFWTLNNL